MNEINSIFFDFLREGTAKIKHSIWVKDFLNRDADIYRNIPLIIASTNVIWNLSFDKVFHIRNFMVTRFTNFVRFLNMYILKIFFTNVSNHSSKMIMIQIYCNALHVWLSTTLQTLFMPFCLAVWWPTGLSTTWSCILKALNGAGICQIFLPYPFCCTLNPILPYSYSDFRQVIGYILNAGFNVLCTSCLSLHLKDVLTRTYLDCNFSAMNKGIDLQFYLWP